METIVESVGAWPLTTATAIMAIYFVGAVTHFLACLSTLSTAWFWVRVLGWPIVTPAWALSWPLRRLGRWWFWKPEVGKCYVWRHGDSTYYNLVTAIKGDVVHFDFHSEDALKPEARPFVCRDWRKRLHEFRRFKSRKPVPPPVCMYPATPEQPGKRAEETMTAYRIRTSPGQPVSPEKAAQIAKTLKTLTDWKWPADSKPDIPPYGSKVSEDAKPISRKEFNAEKDENEATHEAMNGRFARIEERVAALEAQGNDVPKCHFCGGSGMITELSEDSTVPTRRVPCPGCQVRYTIQYY